MDNFVFKSISRISERRPDVWFGDQEFLAHFVDARSGSQSFHNISKRYASALHDRHSTHDLEVDVDPCLPVEVVFCTHDWRHYPTSARKLT